MFPSLHGNGVTLQEEFLDALGQVCQQLFEAYGHAVERDAVASECTVAGVIGFVGSGVRGSVVLATVADVGVATRPVAAKSVSEANDWVGELSNQLLGRLKNHYFLAYGVDIQMSAPVTVSGRDLSCVFGNRGGEADKPLHFMSKPGPITIWSELRLDEGFVLGPKAKAACAEEGGMELF